MTEWHPVHTAKSGAHVWRGPGLHRKEGAPAEIAAEAARLAWLAAQGIPCPEVIDHEPGRLITRTLRGRPADDQTWPHPMRPRLAAALGELLRALHALPIAACPFDHRLAVAIPEAERRARTGRVDLTNLDPARAGWSAAHLLQELHETRPSTPEDLVVGHGDPCRANFLCTDDGTPTGLLDVSRLGLADRHNDLAIATRSTGPTHAQPLLTAYGHPTPNEEKLTYYCLLDEFF